MLEKNLQGCLLYIATMSSQYGEHVPPATEPLRSSPFRISVPTGNHESWGGIIKKMINDSAAPGILS